MISQRRGAARGGELPRAGAVGSSRPPAAPCRRPRGGWRCAARSIRAASRRCGRSPGSGAGIGLRASPAHGVRERLGVDADGGAGDCDRDGDVVLELDVVDEDPALAVDPALARRGGIWRERRQKTPPRPRRLDGHEEPIRDERSRLLRQMRDGYGRPDPRITREIPARISDPGLDDDLGNGRGLPPLAGVCAARSVRASAASSGHRARRRGAD
jgi:hypothetical protein